MNLCDECYNGESCRDSNAHGTIYDPNGTYVEGVDSYGTGGDCCEKRGVSIPGLQDCGFELEFLANNNSEVDDVATSFKKDHNGLVASIESDGSLDDNGAEFVSHYGPID